jgi:hypothetical protein
MDTIGTIFTYVQMGTLVTAGFGLGIISTLIFQSFFRKVNKANSIESFNEYNEP